MVKAGNPRMKYAHFHPKNTNKAPYIQGAKLDENIFVLTITKIMITAVVRSDFPSGLCRRNRRINVCLQNFHRDNTDVTTFFAIYPVYSGRPFQHTSFTIPVMHDNRWLTIPPYLSHN